jgi:hypothetical protein
MFSATELEALSAPAGGRQLALRPGAGFVASEGEPDGVYHHYVLNEAAAKAVREAFTVQAQHGWVKSSEDEGNVQECDDCGITRYYVVFGALILCHICAGQRAKQDTAWREDRRRKALASADRRKQGFSPEAMVGIHPEHPALISRAFRRSACAKGNADRYLTRLLISTILQVMTGNAEQAETVSAETAMEVAQ